MEIDIYKQLDGERCNNLRSLQMSINLLFLKKKKKKMNDGHGQKLNLQLPNSARNTRSPKLFFLFSIKRFVSVTFVGITIKKKEREREKCENWAYYKRGESGF